MGFHTSAPRDQIVASLLLLSLFPPWNSKNPSKIAPVTTSLASETAYALSLIRLHLHHHVSFLLLQPPRNLKLLHYQLRLANLFVLWLTPRTLNQLVLLSIVFLCPHHQPCEPLWFTNKPPTNPLLPPILT